MTKRAEGGIGSTYTASDISDTSDMDSFSGEIENPSNLSKAGKP